MRTLCRSIKGLVVTILALAPFPVVADGLGGLSALRGLFFFLLGSFTVVWVIIWLVLRVTVKRRQTIDPTEDRPAYWLKEPTFPLGLRLLALTQYVLAFLLSLGAFVRLIFPSEYQNNRIADWIIHSIIFSAIFAVLAILSANGYIKRSERGFRLGMTLGWLCVVNAVGYLIWHGPYFGFNPVLPLFGIVLVSMLHWRYRPWFGVDQLSGGYLKTISILRRAVFRVGSLVALVFASSLLFTTLFPVDEDKADVVLDGVAEAMKSYRDQHNEWPSGLDQLDPPVKLTYRWRKVRYEPEDSMLWLPVRIPFETDIVYRLTFGLAGGSDVISEMGRQLK